MDMLDGIGAKFGSMLETLLAGPDWAPLAVVFGAVLIATLAGAALLWPSGSARNRMSGPSPDRLSRERRVSLRLREPDTLLHQVLKGLEKRVVKTNDEERSKTRLRMIHAGFMDDTAIRVYNIVRVFMAVSLPAAFLLAAPTIVPAMPINEVVGIAFGLCVLGLYLPYRWVQSKIESRQMAISHGFPDALDMLVVCVEAGLGLDAAFVRVSQELARPHPVLASLLNMVVLELRAGKSRQEALRNFSMRSGVPDVASFVTLLIQSEALGANLSQTLKVQADEMRATRMLRAEEQGHKLPVKLSMALVAFVLPAMFVVVLGPGIINIARNVLPHLGGN